MVNTLAWLRAKRRRFPDQPRPHRRPRRLRRRAPRHRHRHLERRQKLRPRLRRPSPVANPYQAYNDGQAAGASASIRKLRDTAVLLARCTPYKSDTTCWDKWVDIVTFNHLTTTDAPRLPRPLQRRLRTARPLHRTVLENESQRAQLHDRHRLRQRPRPRTTICVRPTDPTNTPQQPEAPPENALAQLTSATGGVRTDTTPRSIDSVLNDVMSNF